MKKKFLTIGSTFSAFAMMTLVAPAANATSATLPKFIAHRDLLVGNCAIGLDLAGLQGVGIADLVGPSSNTTHVGLSALEKRMAASNRCDCSTQADAGLFMLWLPISMGTAKMMLRSQ